MTIFNAHVHLNGAISLEYLEKTATKNKCLDEYQALISEQDPWKKFGFIHKIIQTTEDITNATIDVVEKSNADIMEIRTTPKPIENQSIEEYVKAFIKGLVTANDSFKNKKARGLLSIDRSRHSLEEAKRIIDIALEEKLSSGMIVGIDLSGNYLAKRTLTGDDLYTVIQYALNKDIGLALHVGEVDSEIEQQDFDLILKAMTEYKDKTKGKIYGKIRLGHAIYRTPAQDVIIKKLKIPIEICPSCHQQLGWWIKDKPHPILSLYQHRSRVIAGTDDDLLFGCNAKEEQRKLDEMLKPSDKYTHLTEDEQENIVANKRKRYMF